jgi:alpha-D-xyloside xylohydrolase
MSEANISPWDFDAKDGGTKALDNFRRYSILHMSLFPYRYAAAQEAARTGMPLMRALVLDNQDDAEARIRKDEYLFGPDLLVAPVIDENLSRTVYFPKNSNAPVATWLDYWTGLSFPSGSTLVAKAPLDVIPVYVRAGAVLPKIPEDVMTLVPAAESGNATIKTLDERRIYEIVGSSPEPITTKDFEGREIVHSGTALKISGSAKAHIIVRWKFVPVQSATMDGTTLQVQSTNGVSSAEFDYTGSPVTVDWK